MTRTQVEVEDLIKDLRDRIQFYDPIYKRKLNRLNEEALIRRAYTVLTNLEMTSREYEEEIRDYERRCERLEDEVENLRWKIEEKASV
jgi:phage shock protein A